MRVQTLRLIVSLLLCAAAFSSRGATVIAIKNGSWTSPLTWSSGTVPKRTDSIIIPINIMVSVNEPLTLGPSREGEVLVITVAGTLNLAGGSVYMDPVDRFVVLPGGKVSTKSFGGMIFSGIYAQYLEGGTLVRGPATLGAGFSPSTISLLSIEKGLEAATLGWTSGPEVEVNYYTVSRSNDGVKFEAVGKVDGRGSKKQKRYSLTDAAALHGLVYYRIDLINSNGVGATAATLEVNFDKSEESAMIVGEEEPRRR